MTRQRMGKIRSIDREKLVKYVAECSSLLAVLKQCNLGPGPYNYRALRSRLEQEQIEYTHLNQKTNKFLKSCYGPIPKISLDKILVEHSTFSRSALKRRLLKEGLLENKCSECEQSPEWHNKPLVMVLDHINGVADDNRLFNLRLLCPNCNSQTSTFSRKKNRITRVCICGRNITYGSTKCTTCHGIDRRKVHRPSSDELSAMLWEQPTTILAKKLGVSDKSIASWARIYGLTKPTRGYWTKIKAGQLGSLVE